MGSRVRTFIGLQQTRQYDMSCREDIGRNIPSADSTPKNGRGNARIWLRKRIWETCGRAS